jgi:hypothetical protein
MSFDKKAKALEHKEETDNIPIEAVYPVVAPTEAPIFRAPIVLLMIVERRV